MIHRTHIGRWIVAGAGALALAGAGAGLAAASAPPTEPTGSAAAGAGPSDCPAIPAASDAPAGSMAPGDSMAPGGSMAPGDSAAPHASAAPVDSAAAPAESDATVTGPFVQIAESEEYGPILVDHECRTLYGFTRDQPGTSSCIEACAEAWPILSVPGEEVPPLADELDPTLFSVIEHPESGPMLQIGDWPLYYFANDMAPGDLNGQGVGGVWWLVAPDGTLIEEATESSAPAGTDDAAADDAAADDAGTAASMPMETTAMETQTSGDDY